MISVLACLLLIGGLATPARATFPGSNGKIAFSSRGDIYTVNSDGSGLTNLTPNTTGSSDTEPAWSPDGTRIAFASDRGSLVRTYDIYVMDPDGGNLVRLTRNGVHDEWPTWSPDGGFIAFSRGQETFGGELWVMRADGTDARRVIAATGGHGLGQPSWSPDGGLIAFVTHSWDVGDAIYVVRPDGTGMKRLSDPSGGRDKNPDWSPDGTRIVFARDFVEDHLIWMMNADGSDPRPITSGSDAGPSWSPDGTRIVFHGASQRDDSYDVWTMNPDGSGLIRVVGTENDEVWPDWQPLP